MKSSKWMIGLLAVVLVLTLAPSSFAQVQLQLFNTPSPREVETNRNAVTADPFSAGAGILVSGQLLANSSLTTTDLTLTFPAPITSTPQSLGPGAPIPNALEAIRIEGAIGLFATASISTVNYTAGTMTLVLPGFPPPAGNTQSGSFRIVGIRLDLNARTAPLALTSAVLSSNANNYIAPTSMPSLISSFGAGIGGFAQGAGPGGVNDGTATFFTTAGSTPIDSSASVVLTEGFASAWRTALQSGTGGGATPNGTQIRLTIAGLPAGVTATFGTSGSTASIPGIALSSTALVGATTQTTITLTSTDMNVTETIPLSITFSGTPTASLTPGATVTLTATLAPLSSATNVMVAGRPVVTGGYPKFTQADTSAVTIANVIAAKTTMLIPYAVRVGTAFDTGIAIANTTKDPFTTGAAVETGGPISFSLYPRTNTGAGTEAALTTSATVQPGTGLEVATGSLLTGGTWTALLSQVMAASTPVTTGDFVGYLFVEANFLDAHGVSYIIQGTTVTSAIPILILQQPSVTARNTTLETLGF